MILTMKDNLSFQENMGYPEDPDMMTAGEVKAQIHLWHSQLYDIIEANPELFTPEMMQLEAFLSNLSEGEVEYTDPIDKTYEYGIRFETYTKFTVRAGSRNEADKKAVEKAAKEARSFLASSKMGLYEVFEDVDGNTVGLWDGTDDEAHINGKPLADLL